MEFVQLDIVDDVRSKLIPVKSVKALLQFAFDNGYYAECASKVLVFFCGVRPDEVPRLEWPDIKLEVEKPFVDLRRTKKRRRRINRIPENAVHWLRLCASKGAVAPGNYEKRMQRLRRKAKIPYPQNAGRHCFCSYHIALYEDGAKTAVLLGHPNPSLLYSTYREVVTKEDASGYFEILPRRVEDARKLEEERKSRELDASERANAEAESCCGKAFKDVSGKWVPVEPVIPDDYEPNPVSGWVLENV